jgi:hypothetical protein
MGLVLWDNGSRVVLGLYVMGEHHVNQPGSYLCALRNCRPNGNMILGSEHGSRTNDAHSLE